jgi:hypothetical protein
MITKKNVSLIAKMSISLTLILWPQLSINSAQANCIHYLPKSLNTMESTEPLIVNDALIVEDIRKAYKALDTQGNDPRAIVLQFGKTYPTALNENEVKPFNTDIESVVAHNSGSDSHFIDFQFRPNSLISLSALQKAFGNYSKSPSFTNRTGSVSVYTIRFRVNLHGKNINIYVRSKSPDLTAERIEIHEISIID